MDTNGVKKAIQDYFDAGYASDGAKMAGVFHDVAHLYTCAEDGSLYNWDKSFFIDIVNRGKPGPDGPGYTRYDEILSIDFVSENTAVARVKVRVADTLYTDILSFLHIDGKWQVISKVFAGVPAE